MYSDWHTLLVGAIGGLYSLVWFWSLNLREHVIDFAERGL